ncbi:helix-turn-helix transcriptional regulator [Hungatella sp.]|uniref:helix-turn-helix domain-containing protein n=1 Tax=Hungatella sp. TaxID=2613924 RepID=UPI002A7F5316|nr:helix-turn-helix transcriptional regulator [Hungatella sp.]
MKLFNDIITIKAKEDKTMYAMDFALVGANIQNKLVEKEMTQQSLADALGISKQVMNKIIKGSKAINVNELARIADILNTSADELLTVGTEPATVDSLSFMGDVYDEVTRGRINFIRSAIDEIHMLEDLLDD